LVDSSTKIFYRVVALTDGIASGSSVWFVVFFNCLASMVVGSSLLNRQDAKDAKVGFMELSRLCGYKALSEEYCPRPSPLAPYEL
jgi:hypothetical protein